MPSGPMQMAFDTPIVANRPPARPWARGAFNRGRSHVRVMHVARILLHVRAQPAVAIRGAT